MGPSALFPIFYNAFLNSTGPTLTSKVVVQPSTSAGNYNLPVIHNQPQHHLSNQRTMPYTSLATISPGLWSAFNTSVGGRLHADGAPFSQPCFDSYELQFPTDNEQDLSSQQEECAARRSGYLSEEYRVGRFGSAMNVRVFLRCLLEH